MKEIMKKIILKGGKKEMKKIILLGVIMALILAPTYVLAAAPSQTGNGVNTSLYHSYDGLVCSDCHTMHNSEGGTAMTIDGGGPYTKLLKRANNTDICLSCHKEGQNTSATNAMGAGDTGWSAPIVMTADGGYARDKGIAMPGGDFYYSNTDPSKGHNPYKTGSNSSVFMSADPVLDDNPPGGVLTGAEWDCHSCHGMHNRFSASYTAWRQLRRQVNGIVHTGNDTVALGVETSGGDKGPTTAGYQAIESNSRGDIQGTNYVNLRQDGSALDAADLWTPESNTNHNIYRGGFSSFCSVCHGGFHGGTEANSGNGGTPTSSTGNTADGVSKNWIRHPTNVPLADDKYNAAKYTVVVTNTQGTNPNPGGYDYKYPLIRVNGTWTTGNAGTVSNDDKVTCLSCHYAHAGKDANALRWDAKTHAAFIANGATDSYGDVSNGDNPAYGCNKCHQKGGAKAFVKGF